MTGGTAHCWHLTRKCPNLQVWQKSEDKKKSYKFDVTFSVLDLVLKSKVKVKDQGQKSRSMSTVLCESFKRPSSTLKAKSEMLHAEWLIHSEKKNVIMISRFS